MQVLFRMVDCEDGSVAIDGVDTKAVGLAALRSRLTIIPQVPALLYCVRSTAQEYLCCLPRGTVRGLSVPYEHLMLTCYIHTRARCSDVS